MAENHQPYDLSLKSLLAEQAAEIIHHLLGIDVEQELNVEILRPPMRADQVYGVRYRGKPHILHLELQVAADRKIASRSLVYHAVLFDRYELPVISVIIYPFRVSMARPPLREESGHEELLTFHYKVVPLWKLDAREFVRKGAVCMYPWLSTMKHADDALLLHAIQEMIEEYSHNETKLARQLVWFGILLRRSDTISEEQKLKVEERINMYESLFEQDPYIQELQRRYQARGLAQGIAEGKIVGEAEGRAVGRAEGKAEGEVEGNLQTLRGVVSKYVQRHFPALAELAEQRAAHINTSDLLWELFNALDSAPDEAAAHRCLSEFNE